MADAVLDRTSDLLAFAETGPVLILLCECLSPEEHVEAVERFKAQRPSARVVVLDDDLEPGAVMRLCRSGVDGLCSPTMDGRVLVNALELVVAGEFFLPAPLGLAVLEQLYRSETPVVRSADAPPGAGSAGRLSDREAQILACLMQGHSNKVIARQLGLAEATVKVHVKGILRKIRAANRTQAAMWARQHLPMDVACS